MKEMHTIFIVLATLGIVAALVGAITEHQAGHSIMWPMAAATWALAALLWSTR